MTAFLAQNMVGASLMMLLVLAVRTPVARAFGARWAYALWLLPLLRLLLPPLPALADVPSLLPSTVVFISAAGDTAAPLPPEGRFDLWVPVLLAFWAGGAAAFLAAQFVCYRRFLARLSFASRSAGAWRGLPLIESEAVDGPIAVGLLDRRIVVPADFSTRYSEEERRLAAEHEYVHHRRGDIWWNLAALLVLALNWFNPIAWFSFLAYRADQELACDAAVVGAARPGERHAYARALVKAASRPGLIAACPLNHADQLKRRLTMMKDHRTTRLRTIGGAASLVAAAGAALALGAPGIAHPHAEGEAPKERRMIIMEDHRDGEAKGGDRVRRFRHRIGDGGRPVGCPEGTELVNVHEESAERREFMILCSQPNATPAQRIEALERARSRIAGGDHPEGEHRTRVLAAIDAALARLRAQR